MSSGTASRPVALTLAVTAAVVVAVTALVATVAVRAERHPTARTVGEVGVLRDRPPPRVGVTEAVASLAVLRDWDAARADAWARGDPGALRRLYVPGSTAGERDVLMLRRWSRRGLVVRRLSTQVLAVELLARAERRIVLLVTDRLAGGIAVPRGGSTDDGWALPRDTLTTRRLTFLRTAGEWRLAAAQPRPLARTALTSGSAGS